MIASGLRFLIALLGLPLLGWPIVAAWTRRLDSAARLATAAAAGAILLTLEMLAATILGIRFGVLVALLPAAALWALLLVQHRKRRMSERRPALGAGTAAALAANAIGIALFTYSAATARVTATDLVLFWGPKGQAFAKAGRIDAAFLGNPANLQMHPDYPPLLPSLYAWATDVAGHFAWGAALFSLPLFLTLSAAALWGFARPALGSKEAAEWTALLVFLSGYGWSVTFAGGGADPVLLFFEVLALSSLVFGAGNRTVAIASLALTGCVLTKLEGLPFAGAVSLAFSMARPGWKERLRRFAALLGPPLLAVGLWVAFCAAHGLLFYYRSGPGLYVKHLPTVLKTMAGVASYDAAYLPWIVVGALLAASFPGRRGGPAALAGLLFLAFIFFVYLHFPDDPTLLITWSAGRLLLTTLTALLVAAASAAAANFTETSAGPEVAAEARKAFADAPDGA